MFSFRQKKEKSSHERNKKCDGETNTSYEYKYCSKPAVVAQAVDKTYKIRNGKKSEGRFPVFQKTLEVNALSDINFVVERGESVGLLGRNGSGKSTLLRLIAGGDPISGGKLMVSSQPTLLGVTPALQPYLTGAQNIYLGCLAIGMTKDEASKAIPEIAAWADIGGAVDRPMNTYSSGMGARLSFAISTAIRPEILLVDEALSTGDAAFARKAQKRMELLLEGAGNLFLVSHAPAVIEQNCDRAIWLHSGKIIADGETKEVASWYSEWTKLEGNGEEAKAWHLLKEVSGQYEKPIVDFDLF